MTTSTNTSFTGPMQPWPAFESYVRRIHLTSSQITLFLYDTGVMDDGPPASPMLLIHGLGDEADTWRDLLPALTADRRVIAVDLPGFGRSDKPKRQYTVNYYQNVLLELLDVLKLARATLIGHSLGAVIAQTIALNHPDRVEQLVLIGGALVAEARKRSMAMTLMMTPGVGEFLYNRLRKDPEAAYRSLAPFYRNLDSLPATEQEFLYQRVNERVWDDSQRYAFFSILRNMARWVPRQQQGLPTQLAATTVPAMAIWGAEDQMNSIQNGRKLVELQPNAELIIIPDAGHNVHQEEPGAVLDAIAGVANIRPV